MPFNARVSQYILQAVKRGASPSLFALLNKYIYNKAAA
jgi:hypothetical protein